jgi:AhpD family alkylhydroperoxidase
MQARMKHPVFVFPAAREALLALHSATTDDGLSDAAREMIYLRASQINGCSVCVEMHASRLKELGVDDKRIFAVSAWRDTPYFSDAERAAFALTEDVTRLADRPEAVSDAVWAEAERHFDEKALAALILDIAQINVWNRLNATIRANITMLDGQG